jgi:uncharacterized protein (TIGR02453 family)
VFLQIPSQTCTNEGTGYNFAMSSASYFSKNLFSFLKELKVNNNRDWFLTNKERYERDVRNPALKFITDFAPALRKINRHFVADPKPHGGSLFRIYRDIRFSEDKSPYKTHIGMHFPHDRVNEVHAPGYYLHLEPAGCFAAAGIWHPDSRTLNLVRSAILNRTSEWKKVRKTKLKLSGDALIRPPKGYPADHPFIEELKMKDFVYSIEFTDQHVCGTTFLQDFTAACRKMSPLVTFLTKAVGLPA